MRAPFHAKLLATLLLTASTVWAERPATGFDDAIARIETTLQASPGRDARRTWTHASAGSVRLVGTLMKPDPNAAARCEVLVGGRPVWAKDFAAADALRHGVDLLVHDLAQNTLPVLRVSATDRPVALQSRLVVVPEPFASRWAANLPHRYPAWDEATRRELRQKGQDILQAIRKASERRQHRIVIPPGDYLFHARWSQASTLAGLRDLEIIADGVTFWFEPPMIHALLFEHCRNVSMRGLTIDFTLPCWFQARVTRVDRDTGTIEATLMPGYEPRDADGAPESQGKRTLMFYDALGHFIHHRHSPASWRSGESPGTLVCHDIGGSGIPAALQPGDHLAGTIRTGAALRSVSCAAMRFEDLRIWSSPGMAVYEGGGEGGNVYHRVRATRRPHSNRLQAFGADIFHLAGADRGPTLVRCEAAYGADDNLNIHGSFGRVVQTIDPHTHHLEGAYAVGDALEFRDPGTLDLLGTAKVVAADASPDGPSLDLNASHRVKGEMRVGLDSTLRLPPLTLVVMDGKRSAAGFVIRDCWLHDNFQRTLINGSPGGLIENTTLQNVGHGLTVQFETWGPWMEGPFARDLVVRGNRFIDAPHDGPALSVTMHPPGGGSDRRRFRAKPVTNLTLTDNCFSRTTKPPVVIHNVDGLRIHDNHLDHPTQGSAPSDAWLQLQDCDHVSIESNLTPVMGR